MHIHYFFVAVYVHLFICIFISLPSRKAVHDNPSLWTNPETFNPDRFAQEFDPYNFLPFINGPRNCLGQHLALLEARIVLSLLTQRFILTPVDERAGDTHDVLLPVCPKHGMFVKVEKRA